MTCSVFYQMCSTLTVLPSTTRSPLPSSVPLVVSFISNFACVTSVRRSLDVLWQDLISSAVGRFLVFFNQHLFTPHFPSHINSFARKKIFFIIPMQFFLWHATCSHMCHLRDQRVHENSGILLLPATTWPYSRKVCTKKMYLTVQEGQTSQTIREHRSSGAHGRRDGDSVAAVQDWRSRPCSKASVLQMKRSVATLALKVGIVILFPSKH